MRRVSNLYGSSIGKKIVMAVTGVMLVGFVFFHMVGNLKVYQGQEKFDAYATFLREIGSPALGPGQFLWIARLGLLAAVGLHIWSAIHLVRMSHQARPTRYHRMNDQSFSYASRTMRWGGLILVGFIVYHILHLTVGSVHSDFSHESPFANVVTAFRSWPVALAYVLCMLPLGFHIYHGMWSMTQTLSLNGPRIRRVRRPASAILAAVIVLGNISIPLAILLGWVG